MPSSPCRATWNMLRLVLAAMVTVWVGVAQAQPSPLPVQVTSAWARASAPGQDSGVVYLTITAAAPDRLDGVSSPDAGSAMLHWTTHQAGVSVMQDAGALAVAPGSPIHLAPQGLHVMLIGLHHPLLAGGTVELDLAFAKAGRVKLSVPVQPIGASGPPG